MASARPQVLPHLLAMLGARRGGEDARILHALDVLIEQLGVDTGFVSRFLDGQRHITHLAGLPLPVEAQTPAPVKSTLCWLIATGELEPLVAHTNEHQHLAGYLEFEQSGLGTYVGVPLVVDGDIVGAVCATSASPMPGLSQRDGDRLATVGEFVGQLLTDAEHVAEHVAELVDEPVLHTHPDVPEASEPAGPAGPALSRRMSATGTQQNSEPATSGSFTDLAALVARSGNLESLTRPLLELLHSTTGLESTYLTMVDWPGDHQQIVHALNTGQLNIPEGMKVPWSDTLCRCALNDGVPYTPDVPTMWADHAAARQLGIQTFVSLPIIDADEAVIGTLCGASSLRVELGEQHLATMRLFGRVLTEQIGRERAAERERERAEVLARRTRPLRGEGTFDALTELHNRNGIEQWLGTVMATLLSGTEQLAIAFVDIDDFSVITDSFGRGAGDDVLRRFAAALRSAGRPHGLVGRWDRSQFVTAAVLPPSDASFGNWTDQQRAATELLHLVIRRPGDIGRGQDIAVRATVGAITVVEPAASPAHALHVAEDAMLRRKVRTRATHELAGAAGTPERPFPGSSS